MDRKTVIEELEEALSNHAIAYRADALRRVTDLFLSAPAGYSDEEIALFDDVMVRLTEEIETSVRAALANRLAKISNAPRNVIRKLAADRAIEVAAPVLRASERLDDETSGRHCDDDEPGSLAGDLAARLDQRNRHRRVGRARRPDGRAVYCRQFRRQFVRQQPKNPGRTVQRRRRTRSRCLVEGGHPAPSPAEIVHGRLGKSATGTRIHRPP